MSPPPLELIKDTSISVPSQNCVAMPNWAARFKSQVEASLSCQTRTFKQVTSSDKCSNCPMQLYCIGQIAQLAA